MAERKAVNKYYPPDWDPRKGSVNKRVGQHPLRDRARKLSQGILVIRFELPYNIWCGGCGSHVGMGVRYNAEKSKVGNYYSTPIYKFRMKCHLCDNYFEIQTDPQNHDYVILCGARRKEQRWDPHANEQIVPEDKATHKKLVTDAMFKLEHGTDDKQKGTDRVKSLTELEESRISMVDDYLLNRMARDKFRSEKHELRAAAEADRALLEKASLSLDLVDETEEDRQVAGLIKYSVTTSFEDKQKEKRKSIEQRPLFQPTDGPKASQPHATPSLRQQDQVKHKLGLALKASFKDPFKTEGKGSGIKSFPLSSSLSSSTSPRSVLGIKLKSPPTSHKTKMLDRKRSSQERTNLSVNVGGLNDEKHTENAAQQRQVGGVGEEEEQSSCSVNSNTTGTPSLEMRNMEERESSGGGCSEECKSSKQDCSSSSMRTQCLEKTRTTDSLSEIVSSSHISADDSVEDSKDMDVGKLSESKPISVVNNSIQRNRDTNSFHLETKSGGLSALMSNYSASDSDSEGL